MRLGRVVRQEKLHACAACGRSGALTGMGAIGRPTVIEREGALPRPRAFDPRPEPSQHGFASGRDRRVGSPENQGECGFGMVQRGKQGQVEIGTTRRPPRVTTRRVTLRLTSLLLVEEKLLEAEYFGRRLRLLAAPESDYELNAFLSAARSVTFLLQKEMDRVSGFSTWWTKRQKVMQRDDAMRFFKDLRNRSQKRGRVSLVGTPRRQTDGTQVWVYRFLGNDEGVPTSLIYRDVVDCCLEHVAKLAAIVLEFTNEFPFQACYRYAMTPEGLESLDFDLSDALTFFGFEDIPRDVWRGNRRETLRLLRRNVDGVDFQAIQRLATYQPIEDVAPRTGSDALSESLARNVVRSLAENRE